MSKTPCSECGMNEDMAIYCAETSGCDVQLREYPEEHILDMPDETPSFDDDVHEALFDAKGG